MADNFKELIALTKETNAKLELLRRQGVENESPKGRILDAAPEILSMERVMNKERTQRSALQKQDEAAEKKDAERERKFQASLSKEEIGSNIPELKKIQIALSDAALADKLGIKLPESFFQNFDDMVNQVQGVAAVNKTTNSKILNFLNKPLTIKQGKEDSRTAEQKKKAEKRQEIFNKGLKGLGDGIKSLARKGFDKVKSGLSGFAKFAMGGLALAALAFINDPVFQKMAFDFTEYIIPRLAYVYKHYIKPLGKALKKFVVDLDAVFKGEKTWFELIKGNKAVSASIAAIFGGSLFISIFSIAGSIALKLLGFIGKGAFVTALKTNPAILKGIGIGMIAVGLYNLAIDGIEEYNKTQDVSKAFSKALAGSGKGMSGAFANMAKGKFSALLGGAGMFLGPMGAAVGIGIGLMIDGILGYFGADAIDAALGKMKDSIMSVIDGIVSFVDNFITSLVLGTKKIFGIALTEAEKKQAGKAKYEVAKTMAQAKVALENEGKKELNANTRLLNMVLPKSMMIPMLQMSKLDKKFDSQDAFETSIFNQKEIERGLKQFAAFNRKFSGILFPKGGMDEMDRADLNVPPLTVINSPRGGDTTNNITTNNVGIRNGDPVLLDLHALHRGG
jgi:hypothetical protein